MYVPATQQSQAFLGTNFPLISLKNCLVGVCIWQSSDTDVISIDPITNTAFANKVGNATITSTNVLTNATESAVVQVISLPDVPSLHTANRLATAWIVGIVVGSVLLAGGVGTGIYFGLKNKRKAL